MALADGLADVVEFGLNARHAGHAITGLDLLDYEVHRERAGHP
jgi:hypothetical protein